MMIVRRRQEGRIVKRIETELSDAKFMCRGSSAVDLARSIMRLRRSDLARDPEGRMLKRLKVLGPNVSAVRTRTGERNIKNRITGLVWKGQADGIYSAHTDGQIRAWLPRTPEDDMLDAEEEEGEKSHCHDDAAASKKRKVLDDVFRDLTRQKITFG